VRFLRWIAFLVVLAALAFVARPYLRGLAFVVRAAGIQGTPGRLASMDASAAGEREFELPLAGGAVHARVYEPSPRRGRAALLVPPIGAAGIDEPALVAMARQLAASGLTIITPAVPELARYEI